MSVLETVRNIDIETFTLYREIVKRVNKHIFRSTEQQLAFATSNFRPHDTKVPVFNKSIKKDVKRRAAWQCQKAEEILVQIKKDREDFCEGDASAKRAISLRRWWRAIFSTLWRIKNDRAGERMVKLCRAHTHASKRLQLRQLCLERLMRDEPNMFLWDAIKKTEALGAKSKIDRALLRIACDAHYREKALQFIGSMGGTVWDLGSHMARLSYFGLTLADTSSTINYYNMSSALLELCVNDRNFYTCFINCPLRYGKHPDENKSAYPKEFIYHISKTLKTASWYWKTTTKLTAISRGREEEKRVRDACPYPRWKRLVRLAILQDRADKESTERNKAENEVHRKMRSTLAPKKTERALTTPGPSHKEGAVRWVEEPPDAADCAKREATKEASLRAAREAKIAKRAREQQEIERELERARYLAIGDAIAEAD